MNLAGLASVIYWGYATFGDNFARNKVHWFLHGNKKSPPVNRDEAKQRVNDAQASIRQRRYGAALGHIGHLPQLGRTPFASKVVAFLAAGDAGVYDNRIMKGLTEHPVLRAVSTSVRQSVSEFTEAPPRARSGKGPGRREAVAVCL